MNTKWFKLVKLVYSTILRPLVVDKIQQSQTEVDDFLLSVLDKIFDYNGNGS